MRILPPSEQRAFNRLRRRVALLERRYHAAQTQQVVFDGVGSELVAGYAGDLAIHMDCLITKWRVLADQPGDIVIDIWKSDFASFPPDVSDTITGSDQPSLSSDDHAESTALTGWTTAISNGDTLRFNIDSASTVTKVTLLLTLIA
jgi:hypothetical protein